MDESTTEADLLNEALDAMFAQGVNSSLPLAGFDALLRADSSTPNPDIRFKKSLRNALLRNSADHAALDHYGTTLGIVATPVLLPKELRQIRKMMTPFAVAAAVLLALFAFDTGWPDGGSHTFGVPTAEASSTAVQVTPTPTATHIVRESDELDVEIDAG